MTDDLLDEATRLADSEWPPAALTIPVLRALVERVRAAEAEAISLRSIVSHETQMREDAEARASQYVRAWRERAERAETFADGRLNEARAKLDKVRHKAELEVIRMRPLGSDERRHWFEVLSILDEE